MEISFNAFCCLLKIQFCVGEGEEEAKARFECMRKEMEKKSLRPIIYVLTRNDDGDKRKSLNVLTPPTSGEDKEINKLTELFVYSFDLFLQKGFAFNDRLKFNWRVEGHEL